MPNNQENRKETTARGEAGFTLMEIMIVLAIIGLIMGVLVLPRLLGSGERARVRMTKTQLDQFALSYEEWQSDHPGESCPNGIDDLIKGQKNKKNTGGKDVWGIPFKMVCGDGAPDGVGFGVTSSGPDKKEGTEDDIKSWD